MTSGQARFEFVEVDGEDWVQVVRRPVMDELLEKVDEIMANSRRVHSRVKSVYVHGPKGMPLLRHILCSNVELCSLVHRVAHQVWENPIVCSRLQRDCGNDI